MAWCFASEAGRREEAKEEHKGWRRSRRRAGKAGPVPRGGPGPCRDLRRGARPPGADVDQLDARHRGHAAGGRRQLHAERLRDDRGDADRDVRGHLQFAARALWQGHRRRAPRRRHAGQPRSAGTQPPRGPGPAFRGPGDHPEPPDPRARSAPADAGRRGDHCPAPRFHALRARVRPQRAVPGGRRGAHRGLLHPGAPARELPLPRPRCGGRGRAGADPLLRLCHDGLPRPDTARPRAARAPRRRRAQRGGHDPLRLPAPDAGAAPVAGGRAGRIRALAQPPPGHSAAGPGRGGRVVARGGARVVSARGAGGGLAGHQR
mmetsp:Transcript_28034/g.75023  ORF Transcript_28034/g.75023 Transcript_28034/m.75023 type:complete len:319 (+) Transcript_28034:288-1244(+)